jgi:hypothetical protein
MPALLKLGFQGPRGITIGRYGIRRALDKRTHFGRERFVPGGLLEPVANEILAALHFLDHCLVALTGNPVPQFGEHPMCLAKDRTGSRRLSAQNSGLVFQFLDQALPGLGALPKEGLETRVARQFRRLFVTVDTVESGLDEAVEHLRGMFAVLGHGNLQERTASGGKLPPRVPVPSPASFRIWHGRGRHFLGHFSATPRWFRLRHEAPDYDPVGLG